MLLNILFRYFLFREFILQNILFIEFLFTDIFLDIYKSLNNLAILQNIK